MPKALTAMPARRMVPPPQQPQPPPHQHQHQHQQSRAGAVPPAIPLSPGQVVAIVREARKKALQGDDSRGVAADVDADGLKPGITLDLIAKNIPTLPDEVVEILRNGVERYVDPVLWILKSKCADFEAVWPSPTTSSPRCQ